MDTGHSEYVAALDRAERRLKMTILRHETRELEAEELKFPGLPGSRTIPAETKHVWHIRVLGFGRAPNVEREIHIEAGPGASHAELREKAVRASADDYLDWKAGD